MVLAAEPNFLRGFSCFFKNLNLDFLRTFFLASGPALYRSDFFPIHACFGRGHLVDMEEETRRELASLQREKELLQAKEKENEDAIDEVCLRKH